MKKKIIPLFLCAMLLTACGDGSKDEGIGYEAQPISKSSVETTAIDASSGGFQEETSAQTQTTPETYDNTRASRDGIELPMIPVD